MIFQTLILPLPFVPSHEGRGNISFYRRSIRVYKFLIKDYALYLYKLKAKIRSCKIIKRSTK